MRGCLDLSVLRTLRTAVLLVICATVGVADDAPPPRHASGRPAPGSDPVAEIDQDEVLAILTRLTSFEPHSGWRNSTTIGESQAIDWLRWELESMPFLGGHGLEVVREAFTTSLGIELRESLVEVTVGGVTTRVAADAPTGHRDGLALAVRFDSDGAFGDDQPDPVVVSGPPALVRSAAEIDSVVVAGRVVFLDYAVIDHSLMTLNEAVTRAWRLMDRQPAAIVMVTSFSNRLGDSHGTFAGDLPAFTWVESEPRVPVLGMRLEDLRAAGISGWDALAAADAATVRWDADLRQPGESAYLHARIPGLDHGQAVILGAHVDSPNTPGALDNGSGSATLLAVARALDRAGVIPAVDLHLVWFGSHERGLYGSTTFVTRHSELLDRTVAMLQMDCLSRTLDGMQPELWLEGWSYSDLGSSRQPWADEVAALAGALGVATVTADVHGLVSDNSSFVGLDVPSMNFIYADFAGNVEPHYGGHLHDPYDTVGTALPVAPVLTDMARVMTAAAVRLGTSREPLRVTPAADRRALFVASHTESPHMTPAGLTELGMALAWAGFDVDVVPFGSPLTAADLRATDLVVALPVHDWPSPEGESGRYAEAWTAPELDALTSWVADGGRLVITNSAHRLKYLNLAYETNEDTLEVNALAERFGVTFGIDSLAAASAAAVAGHQLMAGVTRLAMIGGNGVAFAAPAAEVLAAAGAEPVVAVTPHGAGQVVVIADLGILGDAANRQFWLNLAARSAELGDRAAGIGGSAGALRRAPSGGRLCAS